MTMEKKKILLTALVIFVAAAGIFIAGVLVSRGDGPEDSAAAAVVVAGTLASVDIGRKKIEKANAEAEKARQDVLESKEKIEATKAGFEERKEEVKKEISEMTLEEKVALANKESGGGAS
jgi:type VI protein secretion system component VasK